MALAIVSRASANRGPPQPLSRRRAWQVEGNVVAEHTPILLHRVPLPPASHSRNKNFVHPFPPCPSRPLLPSHKESVIKMASFVVKTVWRFWPSGEPFNYGHANP